MRSACIVGLSGPDLLPEEAQFLASVRPCGIIIFSRNFSSNSQLKGLIEDAQKAVGCDDWLVLVDQEGGRVQRLRGDEWPDFPSASAFGAFYKNGANAGLDAARICNQWLGSMLRQVGINTNCAPCLDVPVPGADAVIGDRAYGRNTEVVSAVGGAAVEGLLAGGVVPVMKHIPGHGRAGLDSHLALPVVDTDPARLKASDFAPFFALRDAPAAMSAHVTFSAIDEALPASVSKRVIQDVVRGEIGFDGLLMSDDVSMQALSGSIGERSTATLAAGSDVVLHCNGVMSEMLEVASVVPKLAGVALSRYGRCLEIVRSQPKSLDVRAAEEALQSVREFAAVRSEGAGAIGQGMA